MWSCTLWTTWCLTPCMSSHLHVWLRVEVGLLHGGPDNLTWNEEWPVTLAVSHVGQIHEWLHSSHVWKIIDGISVQKLNQVFPDIGKGQPVCLFSDLIISGTSAGALNKLWSAWLYCSFDIGLLSVHWGNFNGHEVQFRGFSLVGEKIDLRFPGGIHTLMRDNTRYRISGSQRYSFKKAKKRLICWWIFHSVHISFHAPCCWSLHAFQFPH